MKIKNLEVADCKVEKTEIRKTVIRIFFNRIYNINEKIYINNVVLVVENWSSLLVKLYISDSPFSQPKEEILSSQNIQEFDLIQELLIFGNNLKISGYNKDSGHWMTYEFSDYTYQIIVNPATASL